VPRSTSAPGKGTRAPQAVNLRRAYFDCRYGQLHVRTAFPNTGGFDERTPLVLLHDHPASSRTFLPLLTELGTDRSLYAVDAPGCGESETPPREPTIADYAAAIGDMLDGLRLREVDLLGYRDGSAIAAELAIARPQQVRRVAFVGVPVYTAAEREAFDRAPWPLPPADDGSHATAEWRRALESRGPGETLSQVAATFAERLRNGPQASWSVRATRQWRGDARVGLVRQPALVIRAKDDLWDATQRARALLPQARWRELPALGGGLIGVAPAEIATELRAFYDA
jgi:pimeloyl-ACP methyl ester carboxylesterase